MPLVLNCGLSQKLLHLLCSEVYSPPMRKIISLGSVALLVLAGCTGGSSETSPDGNTGGSEASPGGNASGISDQALAVLKASVIENFLPNDLGRGLTEELTQVSFELTQDGPETASVTASALLIDSSGLLATQTVTQTCTYELREYESKFYWYLTSSGYFTDGVKVDDGYCSGRYSSE